MASSEGPQSLFRGIAPTLLGIGIYSGISFCVYFGSKEIVGHQGASQYFYFGAISGLAGQLAAYPLDVVRKRMQAYGFIEKVSAYKSTDGKQQLKGWVSFFKMIVRIEGFRGLFKGFSMNLVKAPVAAGVVHTVNEFMNRFLTEV